MARVGERYSVFTIDAAPIVAQLHDRADHLAGQDEVDPHDRLAEFLDVAGLGNLCRIVDLQKSRPLFVRIS